VVASPPRTPDQRLARITPTLTYDGFDDADIVVEAVFEEMALKRQVFAELEGVTRPDAILATNTSFLDVDALAGATSRPDLVVGHHFFAPAHVMRLLEIVRGRKTRADVLATSMDLARRLRKVGVLVGNGPGFVGNRMYEAYAREAVFLVEEGNPPGRIDWVMQEFGMAMGPLAVQDLSGLDVSYPGSPCARAPARARRARPVCRRSAPRHGPAGAEERCGDGIGTTMVASRPSSLTSWTASASSRGGGHHAARGVSRGDRRPPGARSRQRGGVRSKRASRCGRWTSTSSTSTATAFPHGAAGR